MDEKVKGCSHSHIQQVFIARPLCIGWPRRYNGSKSRRDGVFMELRVYQDTQTRTDEITEIALWPSGQGATCRGALERADMELPAE